MSVVQAESYAVVRHLVTDVEKLSTEERNHVLWYACDGGDLSMVKSVIRAGCDVDHFHRGHTPLMMASIRGHDDVIKELILAGCKVDLRSKWCFVGWVQFISKMVRAWPALVVWAVLTLLLQIVPNLGVQLLCYWLSMIALAFLNEPFKALWMKSWTKVMGFVGIVLAVVLVSGEARIAAATVAMAVAVAVTLAGIVVPVWASTEEGKLAAALIEVLPVTMTLAMTVIVAMAGTVVGTGAVAGTVVAVAMAVAVAVVRTGATAGVVAVAVAEAGAGAVAVAVAVAEVGTVAGAAAWAWTMAVAVAGAEARAVATALARAGAVAVAVAATVAVAGTETGAEAVGAAVVTVVAGAGVIAIAMEGGAAGAVPSAVAVIVTVAIIVINLMGHLVKPILLMNMIPAIPLLGKVMKTRTLSGTGMTALHYAAWYDHITCGTHLVEGGANMLAKNTYFRTPSHVCSHRFQDAVEQAHSSSPKRVIAVIGNSEYGKSTLISALQSESRTHFQSFVYKFARVHNITQRTTGIEAVPFSSAKHEEILFYDFAGQSDYHGPHQPFLEAMLSKPGTPLILLLLVKATEGQDIIKQQLIRWLQPIALTCAPSPPEVIVIGSFLDQVKSKKMAEQKLKECIDVMQKEFPSLKVPKFFLLDCREPESESIKGLRSYLQQPQPTRSTSTALPYNIDWVMAQLQKEYLCKQTLQLTTFRVWLQDNAQNLPPNLPPPEEVCQDLSAAGCILFLHDKHDLSQSWLILDLQTILHDVYGTLFYPDQDRVNQFGLLHCTHLSKLFPELDLKMIQEVLIALEFCIRVDPLLLKEEILSLTEEDEVGGWLYFPALVSAKAYEVFTPDVHCLHWACWQLKTDDKHIILAHLLQGIILGIAATHVFIEKDLPPSVRKHCCSVWMNGISWRSAKGVDVAVQISDGRMVQVIGRSKVGVDQLYKYLSAVAQCIFTTIAKLSPALKATPYIIHPYTYVDLDESKASPPTTQYPVASIIRSVEAGDEYVHSIPVASGPGCVNYSTVTKNLQELFGDWSPSLTVVQCLKETRNSK